MSSQLEMSCVVDLSELVDYADSATVSKTLYKKLHGNTSLFAFDKGQELSEHTAPFDATVLILEGVCTLTIDRVEYVLREGQLVVMPANVPHALKATERFKMLLIMIKEKKDD